MEAARWCRGALVLLLFLELLTTLPWPLAPWPLSKQLVSRPHVTDWRGADDPASVQYHSSALLARCQAAMRYNKATKQYEAGPLALWRSVEATLASSPAASWVAMQQLVLTAKQPWAMYWTFYLVPSAWRLPPQHIAQDKGFLQAGLPVLRADPALSEHAYDDYTIIDHAPTDDSSGDADDGYTAGTSKTWAAATWLLNTFLERLLPLVPRWQAVCTSAVDDDTLQPVAAATCTVHTRGKPNDVAGGFTLLPDSTQPAGAATGRVGVAAGAVGDGDAAGSCNAAAMGKAAAAAADAQGRAPGPGFCPYLGPGLLFQPLLRRLYAAAQRTRATALMCRALLQLWLLVVPSGRLSWPLCPLLAEMELLAAEFPLKAALLYTMVAVSIARNWLYLSIVAYKVKRRLSLVAAAPQWTTRLSGTALTLLGVYLGLWQSLIYASLDIAFDAVLAALMFLAASHSQLLATVLWHVSFTCGLFEVRVATKVLRVVKLAWGEARSLVLTPQALLRQRANEFVNVPRFPVPTAGTWPEPLVIPDEVDELPVSEVPRGFICPITQGIMREPALLLHDGTINPSTYDKAAITQWLSQHRSDPKNPGVQLCSKSVKLVYNGDLGRAIEDWVKERLQQQQQQQQQHQQHQQQLQGLAGLQAWLAGQGLPHALQHLAAQQQQHHSGQQQQHGAAAAAAALLMQLRAHGRGLGGTAAAEDSAAGFEREDVHSGDERDDGDGDGRGNAAQAAAAAAGAGAGPAAPVPSGSILSDAGALVRTSSAALMQVASLDFPAVAAAGLNQLANNTRRATRAALRGQSSQQQQQRHQQQRQPQPGSQRDPGGEDDSDGDGADDRQQQRGRRHRQRGQQRFGSDFDADDDVDVAAGARQQNRSLHDVTSDRDLGSDGNGSDEASSKLRGQEGAGGIRQRRGGGGSSRRRSGVATATAAAAAAAPASTPPATRSQGGRSLRPRPSPSPARG